MPDSNGEVNQAAIAAGWRVRGFSCALWVDPPGQVWSDFVHPTDEVVLLVEGSIELEVGKHVIRPRVGEEVVIPSGVSHIVRNTGSRPARWLYGYRRSES